ncbi:PREDICTED: B3 domain-containing protein Os07g0563300-like isoform X1 [Lupinus angustifolius]|uniref:B3 domain-containing protein Os07g0563300-like isoform X1 n=1 Tax=Lupinus angustifolius TaxID=3871 RepID=UPI00092E31F3|nr:PREDICTED: B3 domain-containing protein Os07g0563300-like isoform X1 [Lupinus angustifolius]
MASISSSNLLCFNPDCKEFKSERPNKGWRLRNGELAQLCDRCGSAFEEGRFCDIFHSNASGWRNCETCRKGIHCGCIVSSHAFVLLDPGGIECFACARKHILLPSNPTWSPPFSLQNRLSERLRDLSAKSWSQLAGSGPVPWKQAPSLFNSISSSDMCPDVSPLVGLSNGIDKIYGNERLLASSLEKKNEDLSGMSINWSTNFGPREMMLMNGMRNEDKSSSCLNMCQQPPSLKDDLSLQPFALSVPYATPNERNGQVGVAGSYPHQTTSLPGKPFSDTMHLGLDSSGETQVRNGRPRADARGRNQLLPRYWPRCTDLELQKITIDSTSVITPLFQKTLSASDAGRIGRLVLPKKCAEAYFPPISHPEGLPLKILDAKGKEWIFQFRFWPNNNSRMYVLEGVTPCIQSMQLQAGDTVTFSRLEPEGRLVMGFRKASSATPSDQVIALNINDNETNKTGNGFSAQDEVELADASSWSKIDKSGYIAKDAPGGKSSMRKRKNSILGSKSKRLRLENEDVIELKITWQEAQGLLRPPPSHVASIVVIEGFEFEEYEDAPVLGKPTIFTTDNMGEKIQWAQCEDCLKWRKLPASALLTSKWTCSDNSWDPERSSCSAAQELTAEQLENMLPPCSSAFSKKMKAAKQDPDNAEALEGLDTLANLAILGEGEALPSSSQATTKHPRHRPGCSCIVCIQPPSGKGPKHKQTCTCNVCLTVKRRFRTLMLRREKKQSEREAETTHKKQKHKHPQPLPSSEILLDDDSLPCSNTGDSSSPNQNKDGNDGSDEDPVQIKSSTSPFKGQIDLNIRPEREEEFSPLSDSSGMMKLPHDTTDMYPKQQTMLNSSTEDTSRSQSQKVGDGVRGEKLSNGVSHGSSSDNNGDKEHAQALPMNV